MIRQKDQTVKHGVVSGCNQNKILQVRLFFDFIKVSISYSYNLKTIWDLSDSNGIRTHNHLVCIWTLNHFANLKHKNKTMWNIYIHIPVEI